ncbi:MAG: serine/threonine protein kinase [Myxococcales bacterium]|nr:serine/threonine protein kinase [Myxococcales bacterium]
MSDPKPASASSDSSMRAKLRARGLPAPGDVVAEKYRLGEVLGRGAMGCVMAAEHLLMQRKVAIKFVLGFSSSPNATDRFVREARVTQSLQDEHVVRVYDLGVLDNGTPYLVMEYLEGQDLAQLLRNNQRFPTETAVDYILGACEALAEAHAAGIVHRDIKPSNLILTQRKNGTPLIKVVDFGISKVLDDEEEVEKSLTGSVAMLGSPLYMSPEQIRSAKAIDARADVWALGVTLYACLSGEAPFDGEGVHGVCASIVADPPRPFPEDLDLPEGLEEALSRCLAKRPEERTPSVAALAAELGRFATKRGRLSADRIATLYAAPSPESARGWQPKLQSEATLDADAPVSGLEATELEGPGATLNHPTSQTIGVPLRARRRSRFWIPALAALGLLAAGAGIGRLKRDAGAAPAASVLVGSPEETSATAGQPSDTATGPASSAAPETALAPSKANAPSLSDSAKADSPPPQTPKGSSRGASNARGLTSAAAPPEQAAPKASPSAPPHAAAAATPVGAAPSARPASRATDDDGFTIPD